MTDRGGAQVVVGGTVAALVAADALAATGRPVRLSLPRKGVGGGFMPVERDGHVLELGMRVLELGYEGVGASPPLAEYRADGDGHRPFVGLVDAWVRDLVGAGAVVPVDPPASFAAGRTGPEFLLGSDVRNAVELVDTDTARDISTQAAEVVRVHGDAGLLQDGERARLWRTDFDTASVHQHGSLFHEQLLAPFLHKVRPTGGSDLVAALRRKLWLPLFWPRTVAEAFAGRPVQFVPDRPLSVVGAGGMGSVVRALLARLETAGVDVVRYDAVDRVERGRGTVRISFSDGRVEEAVRPVLGLAAGELLAATGIVYEPSRVHSVLTWLLAHEDDIRHLPGFLHVLDPEVAAYRVTPGERDARLGTRVLCVELAHHVEKADAAGTARTVLEQVGMVAGGADLRELGVFSGPTFTDPTADSLERFEEAVGRLRALELDAVLVGGVRAFGVDAFNDQVVQGLQAAELTS
ncbi:hypothetical protein GB931_11910 [Modestobacter sp. I12A-02628]|uniref:Protoporphyrinogen oxidase n=1 Tax=Goekera deserti TaxID=2497753 RepID=A0A7K3WCJ9_9ACTN|nr:hypothetical protein [Goekera deserti]MPQ98611.1 hypothetical protein [Goekera deserti]NDI49017.1 hypothetical protein [Goekera deserti]NEL54192.1 hypothetical protein [Goekera deserti]